MPGAEALTRRLRRDWPLLAMVAPAIAVYAVFHYVPLLGNVIAFQSYSPYTGIGASPFVGLYNFQRIFSDPGFWQAAANTVTITLFQLVFYFPVPILLALLLNSLLSARLRMLVQSVVYLPHFFSWVLVITLFQQVLGGTGAINAFLREQGAQTVDIMNNPDLFLGLVTLQSVWKDAGWGTIIFLAALSTVDSSLYEAAAVDGAGRWRRLWHVTLPALVPVIVLLLILRLGDALSVGFEQFLLQRDAVGADTAEVLDTYVYFTGVVNNDWSYAAAAGLVKGVVGLLLVLGANKLAHVFGQQGVYQR
ncbi:ABC transporter permease [Lentzea sp.]|uniref:ABC transporter permease n=1 Tax=Lentzea sp. TaxID=56099 RepID=UPI002CA2BDDD|nr:ABC transporter permease subunit [Lentzea sp.]HUQ60856.1 ABC transporter permease subunit [Lentzea sp.]